jgi:hypothetical protein
MSQHQDIFDYATILIKMDKLCKELHDACLHNHTDGALQMTNEMVVQTRMLRAWINQTADKQAA